MKKMEALNNKILKAVECLAAILMASIAVMILIQVISRGLRIGLQWPDEMSRFAYVALVFLGNIVAVSRKKNITITLLLDYLPGTARKIFDVAIDILTLLFGLFAMKGSILLMGSAAGVHANSLVWFQLNYLYGLMLCCLFFMCLESCINIIMDVLPDKEKGNRL